MAIKVNSDNELVGFLAEYIARADELVKRAGDNASIRRVLDENIDDAYLKLKEIHPDPEGVIEQTWNNIADLENGQVNPLEDHNTSFDQFLENYKEPGSNEQLEQAPTFYELSEKEANKKLLDLLQNFSLERKTPDADKSTKVYKSKGKDGTTNYSDDEMIARHLSLYDGAKEKANAD